MRLLLLFPPGWRQLQEPYLALPALTAYLKAQGCTVAQRDLNIAFFHHLCSKAVFADLYARGQERFWQLNRQASLSAIGQTAYADLAWMVLQPPERFHEKLLKARSDLQGDRFYSIASCWAGVQTFNDLHGIVRALQARPQITGGGAPVQYPEESSAEILAAVEQAPSSLYWEYYRQELAREAKADVVGISITDPGQLIPGFMLGRFLKEQVGVSHVTIGGNVITRLQSLWPHRPEFFRYCDSMVLYEGEGPLWALTEAIARGGDLSQVPNLLYLDGQKPSVNAWAPPVPIDEFPTPDFEGLPLRDYLVPETILPLQMSRGCYWGRCAFCNFDKGTSAYHTRSPERVVDDLGTLAARHGVQAFAFVDDALRPQPAEAVADRLLASNLEIAWEGSARFDRAWTAERCRKIAQAGCRTLSFGLESANRRVLKLMKKGIVPELVVGVLKNCAEAGIVNRVNLFFGFPGETVEEAQETQDFVLAHRDLIHGVDGQRYTISRCSPVAQAPERFRVTITPDSHKDMALRYYDYETAGGMSRAQSRALSLQLYREIQARHPYFAVAYYPVVLYTRHFGTRSPLVLVEQSRRLAEAPAEERGEAGAIGPQLRQDIGCALLAYDLTTIRRHLNEGYEEVEPIESAETWVLVDVGERRVYKLTPFAAFVLQSADGSRSLGSIAAAAAERFGLARDDMESKCNALLQMYTGLLLHDPQRKDSQHAHRLSIPA